MHRLLFAGLLLCLALPMSVFAQETQPSCRVSDASGALIPGVKVSAANINTGIVSATVSNESGAYQFSSLQPGTYTLAAALTGFDAARLENPAEPGTAAERGTQPPCRV